MSIKRVLVVDDEEDLTWSIARHLEKDRDKYQLYTVNNGKEALELLNQIPMDVVVSDIRMPEISGLDLLLKIRENYPQTKVIIMTAYGSSEVQEEANARGCFKYLEKPFEIHELREMILAGVEERRGFEGKISDFQLSDIIQMNCLGRLTNALHVQQGSRHGTIYFEDGDIVHSVVGDLEGEEAFYEIISWEGGTFQVERAVKAPRETIVKGWQSLLMEGLRLADEKRNSRKAAPPDKETQRRQKLETLLKKFAAQKGVILCQVLDQKGNVLSSFIHDKHAKNYDAGQTATALLHLFRAAAESGQRLHFNAAKEVVTEFDGGRVMVVPFQRQQNYFAVVADVSLNLAVLRMETKKLLPNLAKVWQD